MIQECRLRKPELTTTAEEGTTDLKDTDGLITEQVTRTVLPAFLTTNKQQQQADAAPATEAGEGEKEGAVPDDISSFFNKIDEEDDDDDADKEGGKGGGGKGITSVSFEVLFISSSNTCDLPILDQGGSRKIDIGGAGTK